MSRNFYYYFVIVRVRSHFTSDSFCSVTVEEIMYYTKSKPNKVKRHVLQNTINIKNCIKLKLR